MKRFHDILFVSARGRIDDSAFERAIALAAENKARLTATEVIEELPPDIRLPTGWPSARELERLMAQECRQVLDQRIAPLQNRLDAGATVLVGTPFIEIIREVIRSKRDLVVKMADGDGGFADQLFGSDDRQLLRKCPCPVWLIKAAERQPYRTILAAVDVSDTDRRWHETKRALNLQVLELASSLALAEDAELHLVHIWHPIAEAALRHGRSMLSKTHVDDYVETVRLAAEHGLTELIEQTTSNMKAEEMARLKLQTHLVKGTARTLIPTLAEKLAADVLILGTVARTGIPGFVIGNTAEEILNRIDCSVLAIKPQGFASPVTLEA